MRVFAFTFLVILGTNAVTGCGSKYDPKNSKDREEKQDVTPDDLTLAPEAKLEIKHYVSFLGLNFGDKIDALVAKIGNPSSVNDEPKYSFVTNYYDDVKENNLKTAQMRSSYYRENSAIYTIGVQSAGVEFLKSKGITDRRLEPLSMNHDEVLKTFGKPKRENANFITYDFEITSKKTMLVSFYCPDYDAYKCNEINLFWFTSKL